MNITRRMVLLSSLAVAALVTAIFILVRIATQASEENLYLPQMTIIYENDGPVVKSGDDPSQTIREVHRLEYRSETDWLDTVIESQSADVVAGDFKGVYNTTGSYGRLDGRRFMEFRANFNHHTEETIEPNTVHLPDGALQPYHLDILVQEQGIKLVQVTTGSMVCYHKDCEENVEGLLYVRNGEELVFLDDPRWDIPLRLGSRFVVRELRIERERP